MQKYLLIPLFLVGYATAVEKTDREKFLYDTDRKKLQHVIGKLDVKKVKKLLRRMGDLQRADRTSLVNKAQATLSKTRQNVSLLSSRWDLAKLIGGSTVAGVGSYVTLASLFFGWRLRSGSSAFDSTFNLSDQDDRDMLGRRLYVGAGVSGVIALVGGYYALKGYYCDTAYGRVKIARKIATLIKEARIEEVQEPEIRALEVQKPEASQDGSSTPLRTES